MLILLLYMNPISDSLKALKGPIPGTTPLVKPAGAFHTLATLSLKAKLLTISCQFDSPLLTLILVLILQYSVVNKF